MEKKSYATREKKVYFTREIVALPFTQASNSNSQNKFFLPSCIIYYLLLAVQKVHFIPLRGSNNFMLRN